MKNNVRVLQNLDRTITSDFDRCFKQENIRRMAKISSEKETILRLIFYSTITIFGIIFAVAEFTIVFFMLALIIGIIIGSVLGVILDKAPDFKSCKVIINSNNEVIVQNRSRNGLLSWYLNFQQPISIDDQVAMN